MFCENRTYGRKKRNNGVLPVKNAKKCNFYSIKQRQLTTAEASGS